MTSATPTTKDRNDSIYTVTVDLQDSLVGTTFNYKFWTSQGTQRTWENDGVGAGGANNRFFTLQVGGQDSPLVYINNDTVVAVREKVLFQVDMCVMLAGGLFQPDGEA